MAEGTARMEKETEERDDEKGPPSLPGELADEILRRLSTADLAAALCVSPAWRRAVHAALRCCPRRKPWLFLHTQRRRSSGELAAAHAYDPHSCTWLRVPAASAPRPSLSAAVGAVPCADLLYELTPSRLTLRHGSLGGTWRRVGEPRAWRTDPVVAAVGEQLVIAGGAWEDPCDVEVFRTDGRAPPGGGAAACEPLPEAFRASASATFLSAAAEGRKVHVIERSSGLFCSLDVETRKWGPTRELRPDPSVCVSAISSSGEGLLLLAGLQQDGDGGGASLKLWAVDGDTLACTAIGEMPKEMADRLGNAGDLSLSSSFEFTAVGDFGYIYRPSDPTAIFSCEIAAGGCNWTEVQAAPPAAAAENPMDRYVFTCSRVGIEDLLGVLRPAYGGRRTTLVTA